MVCESRLNQNDNKNLFLAEYTETHSSIGSSQPPKEVGTDNSVLRLENQHYESHSVNRYLLSTY